MYALINSKLTPAADAQISITERGFRFGDGVFETIAIHGGTPYQWTFHMDRLRDGLHATHITASLENIEADCHKLLDVNQITDGFLRIYISRGQGGHGYVPDINAAPLTVIEAMTHTFVMPEPVDIWVSQYEKISPKSLPVASKIAQGMQSTLVMLEAVENQCADGLMLNASGHITETSCGNIFWLIDGKLYTPSLATGALNGSTRHALLQLSPWPAVEGEYTLDNLKNAEAVIVTNCRVKAQPAACLKPYNFKWDSESLATKCYELLRTRVAKR
jgi:branched-subunit amino acid aminotransferase/4-amino-4-deoxychorismate lyase